jgi:mannose-1-phosphate guanylyltransferase
MAVTRLEVVFPPERILIVTSAILAAKLQQQTPQIPKKNYILEPIGKGTASAVGLAAVAIKARDEDPETTMAVLTADHFIRNVPYFRKLLDSAFFVSRDGYLVTLGIRPTYPSTGYGYIQHGDWIGGYEGHPVYKVLHFVEKPDETRAKGMVKEGNYDWNSGMFIWKVDRILNEIENLMPELWSGLLKLRVAWNSFDRSEVLETVWEGLKTQSIDYGIMEKAAKVVIIPAASLGWSDVGSWESLFEILPNDDNGNVVIGAQHLGIDTNNTMVYAEKSKRLIVTLGARNLIIVDTGDTLLICPREESQNVRKIIDHLNDMGRDEYL